MDCDFYYANNENRTGRGPDDDAGWPRGDTYLQEQGIWVEEDEVTVPGKWGSCCEFDARLVEYAAMLVVDAGRTAVAIEMNGDMPCPRIIAVKWSCEAERMTDAAREYGIPVVHNGRWAREMSELSAGDWLPVEFWEQFVVTILSVNGGRFWKRLRLLE